MENFEIGGTLRGYPVGTKGYLLIGNDGIWTAVPVYVSGITSYYGQAHFGIESDKDTKMRGIQNYHFSWEIKDNNFSGSGRVFDEQKTHDYFFLTLDKANEELVRLNEYVNRDEQKTHARNLVTEQELIDLGYLHPDSQTPKLS